MAEADEEAMRSAIVHAHPGLSEGSFSFVTMGWDSVAVDVDDRWIFKFPRTTAAEKALIREAALLDVVRPNVAMPVPDLRLHEGPPLFSSHRKLPGAYLLAADYERLTEKGRSRIATDLGHFYAELHRLDFGKMERAGAPDIQAWENADIVASRVLPLLAGDVRRSAEIAIDDYQALGPDPFGSSYGFFDGHGWNMAFDRKSECLRGIYDFADSGFGPVHQDFIYSNFISRDLTSRIISAYETATGRLLDRRRIERLTAMHRLSELAYHANDPDHRAAKISSVEDWFSQQAS